MTENKLPELETSIKGIVNEKTVLLMQIESEVINTIRTFTGAQPELRQDIINRYTDKIFDFLEGKKK